MADKVILVPLDGSALAERVLPYVQKLARDLDLSIRLLFVSDSPTSDAKPGTSAKRPAIETPLVHVAERLRARGLQVACSLERGRPAERILAAARKRDVELVAMATHGRGGLNRMLIGSVADEVMRTCPKPALLCVPPDRCATPSPVEMRRVVVPLDGSRSAEAALPFATELALASGATLILVRILRPIPGAIAPAYLYQAERLLAKRATAARHYLSKVRERMPHTITDETLVLSGRSPAEALESFVETSQADLLVLSSRGRGGAERLVAGSTADSLVRAGVPIVVVHPRRSRSAAAQARGQDSRGTPLSLPAVREQRQPSTEHVSGTRAALAGG